MILRRLAEGIKNQDWFVVVVEILIVVVGIYIGLQVDDWNKARQDRADEKVFMVNLHDDILNAKVLSKRQLDRRLNRQIEAIALVDVVFNQMDRETLSEAECITLSSLHYFNVVISDLSSVSELASTGRMAIIQNAELRTALAKLDQARAALHLLMVTQLAVTFPLPSKYPELIKRNSYFDEDRQEISSHPICDLPAMRKNRGFLNDFGANADAFDAYVIDALRPWANQFDEVHRLVDLDLGITHEGETQ